MRSPRVVRTGIVRWGRGKVRGKQDKRLLGTRDRAERQRQRHNEVQKNAPRINSSSMPVQLWPNAARRRGLRIQQRIIVLGTEIVVLDLVPVVILEIGQVHPVG